MNVAPTGNATARLCARIAALVLAATTLPAAVLHAQNYPSRPVRLMVATSPGGGTDALARILGNKLSERLGQQFVVDNRAGGSGIVGTEVVVRALPDGHTLLMGFISSLVLAPAMMPTPYDVMKDLAPVCLVADAQYMLVVHPSLPARSLKDFVAYVKAHPGRVNVASAGYGTPVHLSAELFKLVAGLDMVTVTYKGGGPAATAALSGESQVIFGSISATLPQINAGRLVALGTTGLKRSAAAPQYPTIAEQGFSGFEVTSWYALMTPTGTPAAVIAKLNTTTNELLRTPDLRDQMARQGLEPTGGSPADAVAYLRNETAKWRRVIKEAGIKAQ